MNPNPTGKVHQVAIAKDPDAIRFASESQSVRACLSKAGAQRRLGNNKTAKAELDAAIKSITNMLKLV
jgi:hypothetical protein